MFLLLGFACATPSTPEPEAVSAETSTSAEAPAEAPAPAGRPGKPGLPVALFASVGDKAAPLGGVPAPMADAEPAAVEGWELSKWPIEGVDAATADGGALTFTGSAEVVCGPSGEKLSGGALSEPLGDLQLVFAPSRWADVMLTLPDEGPDEALTAQLSAQKVPAERVVVVPGDLDGDGQADRLVFAHGPQVDPEKPAGTTVWWGASELSPLTGFEFNGAIRLVGQVPTPAGPLMVLRSDWMGGSGLHVFVVEGSKPRALGEWVCGT